MQRRPWIIPAGSVFFLTVSLWVLSVCLSEVPRGGKTPVDVLSIGLLGVSAAVSVVSLWLGRKVA